MSTVAEPVAAVHTTATPRIAFRDPAKAIEFYKQALGATEKFRFQVGDEIPHAELMIGDSSIAITGEWPEGNRFSAETLGNSPILLVVRVPDVDAFAERAVAAGMKVVRPLQNQFYGHRDVTLADPFGYLWTGVSVIEEMSVEEMHRRMKGLTQGPEGGKMPQKDEPKVSPVPRGFRMVTPYLVAEDGLGLLEFAKEGSRRRRTDARRDADRRTRGSPHRRYHADDGRRAFRARSSPARCSRTRCTFT